jgi:hypothetical protein
LHGLGKRDAELGSNRRRCKSNRENLRRVGRSHEAEDQQQPNLEGADADGG